MKIQRLATSALVLCVTAASFALTPSAAADPDPMAPPRATVTPSGFSRVDHRSLGKINNLPSGLQKDKVVSALVELRTDPVVVLQASNRSLDRSAARERVSVSQDQAVSAVSAAGATVYGRLGTVINALQIRVKVGDLAKVADARGVRRVQVSHQLRRLNSASNAYTGVDRAWQNLGLTGRGQTVAIIDTGIDYTHADFGGPGTTAAFEANDGTVIEPGTFPTARVVGGYDLVGDAYDPGGAGPGADTPKPDPDPLDCEGHGTHVAGTAAGSGVTTAGKTYAGPYDRSTTQASFRVEPGAAPEASLLAYRVFGCVGAVNDDIIVAAIDRAVSDGADVINMSLASDFGTADNLDDVAIANATAAGVLVVASAGNSGSNAYVVGSPATSDTALAVAATDDEFAVFGGVKISGAASASGLVANEVAVPAGLSGAVLDAGLGCEASDYAGAAGKIVVTLRGTCDRVERPKLGQAAGAKAVIMVNTDETLPPLEGPIEGVTIPFVGVASTDGPALRAAAGSTVALTAAPVENPGYGATADFSSNGPRAGDSAQKPDVSAPGVAIPSAAVGTGSDDVRLSGTSMAAPHTAGVAALVRQAHPTWDAAQTKAVIMSTASPKKVRDYDTQRNGPGEVAAYDATRSKTYAWTSGGLNSVRFGSNELSGSRSERRTFHITNASGRSVTYRLKAEFSGSKHGASISISPRTVKVKPGRTRSIGVTLKLSRADVRKLPGASAADQGALPTIKGSIVATPSGSSSARPTLRTSFLHVPVPLSDVQSSSKVDAASGGALSPIALDNQGVHSGASTVFSWLLADPAGDATGRMMQDITNVGVEVLPGEAGGSTSDDRLMVFVTSQAYALSTQSFGETDLLLDVNGDDELDFILVGADASLLGVGEAGVVGAALVDAKTSEIVDAFLASGPANGSTLELPVLTSSLGLSSGQTLGVSAVSFSPFDVRGFDEVGGIATVDPFNPALSSGQQVDLKPGEQASVAVTADQDAFAGQTHLGWLVVTPDDRAGLAETDRVQLALPESAPAAADRTRKALTLPR